MTVPFVSLWAVTALPLFVIAVWVLGAILWRDYKHT